MNLSSVFWDFRDDVGLPSSEGAASRAEHAADRSHHEFEQLNDRMDRLTLLCAAMWSLLQEKTGLDELELIDRVNQIDLTDGELDGRVRRQVANCPKCKRTMSARHMRCLYCGQPMDNPKAFDSVL